MKRKAPISDPIERAARPFLPKILKAVAEQGAFPGDYFLILGKYDSTESVAVPRSEAHQFLAMAKTEVRRRKYERLLDSPCDRNVLLVMVCAGDHVEGHWMQVPAVAPAQDPSDEERMQDAHLYMRKHMGQCVRAIRQKGERLGDWLIILRMPDEVPIAIRRKHSRASIEKLGQFADVTEVLRELDAPADDDEVFCVHAYPGKLAWFRTTPTFMNAEVAAKEDVGVVANRLAKECHEQLREVGEDPCKYMAFLRWPAEEGKGVEPLVFPRTEVHRELRAMEGTKKYQQILDLLADPYDGVMVFVDDASRADILMTFRDDGQFAREANALVAEVFARSGLDKPPPEVP
jgi:hypothetical protein